MEDKTVISKNELDDLYNKLQLKDKMIELMSGTIYDTHFMKALTNKEKIIDEYKQQALSELEQ